MWYVYFFELRNCDIYVGLSNDLKRRVNSHQKGHVRSTKAYCPVVLRSYAADETEEQSRQLERYFKSGSGHAFAKKHFW